MNAGEGGNTGLWMGASGLVFVSRELIDAIKQFPVKTDVEHCGHTFQVSSLDFNAPCPRCFTEVKLRSFSGDHEFPAVFDAVIEWMLRNPGAEEMFDERKATIRDDLDY